MKQLIKDNKAASPVIGVMLMIAVTVILAAAVSSYSSGIAKPTAVAPSGSWDVKIKATGSFVDSIISLKYLSGDPIPSKDIKIVMEHKGNVTETSPNNVRYSIDGGVKWVNYSGPIGYVNGTSKYTWSLGETVPDDVQFGNYTIQSGVMLKASPSSKYDGGYAVNYTGTDPTQALLKDWQYVQPGDKATVQIIHLPSGKAIFKADVTVEG
jgi:flagellin-like protein